MELRTFNRTDNGEVGIHLSYHHSCINTTSQDNSRRRPIMTVLAFTFYTYFAFHRSIFTLTGVAFYKKFPKTNRIITLSIIVIWIKEPDESRGYCFLPKVNYYEENLSPFLIQFLSKPEFDWVREYLYIYININDYLESNSEH